MPITSGRRAEPRVRATVNYVRNAPSPGAPLEFVTEDESRSTMETLPGRVVWIDDARGRATDLDREGFALVAHRSAVPDFDLIEEDAAIDVVYRDEMEALLQQLTGATRVIMLGSGKKRYGESATDKLSSLSNAKPARYPHADNTDVSATVMVEMVASFLDDLELGDLRRWALFNMWRAVSPPPQDVPLAVCDSRTVAPDDEVTVSAVTHERRGGEIRHETTGYAFNPAHRWHYFPDMTRDEVLVFKAHDTDPSRASRVPHTALTDPGCPDGVPTRASVESRGLALFA